MNHSCCGCHYVESTIYEPGYFEPCPEHEALYCVGCGEVKDKDESPNDDGLCPSCADPDVECDYCHRQVPRSKTDNGAICWDCLAANWAESEAV